MEKQSHEDDGSGALGGAGGGEALQKWLIALQRLPIVLWTSGLLDSSRIIVRIQALCQAPFVRSTEGASVKFAA